ncbi:MAG TPA: YceI family protein [Xanthomonadales bacterium]|nr:YceI family protein [Xanthomonadales bacterium]
MILRTLSAVALLALAPPAIAKPERFEIDPVHTQVYFLVSHLGFSRSLGKFAKFSGELVFDGDDWSTAKVDATVDVASLYLGDAGWEKKVLSDSFFDAKQYPTARFVSTKLMRDGTADRGKLEGQLTLRGVTRPVVFDVVLNRVGRDTFSFRHVAGFSAHATVKRSEFGMRGSLPAVGDEVEIRLEVESVRKGKAKDGD